MDLKTKCPVCGNELSTIQHVFFNNRIGLECDNCKSILNHSLTVNIIKLSALLVFLIFFVKGLEESWLWLILAFPFFFMIIVLQLKSPFKVMYQKK